MAQTERGPVIELYQIRSGCLGDEVRIDFTVLRHRELAESPRPEQTTRCRPGQKDSIARHCREA
jgi:hypothetical protein